MRAVAREEPRRVVTDHAPVPDGDEVGAPAGAGPVQLEFTETEKVFDPAEVYGDAPNPTQL